MTITTDSAARSANPAVAAGVRREGDPVPSPVRPEDLLPDDQNSAEINGTVVRKGTVAAFLANARTLGALPPGSPDREPIIEQLRGSAQVLREIGLFDVFELRSRELAELIGLIVVAVLGSAISAALGTVTGLAGKVAIDATNAYPSRSEAFRHKRRRAGLYGAPFLASRE